MATDTASTSVLAEEEPPKPTIKKPWDSAFRQQRLPAWQPILTAGSTLPIFFVIGFIFLPVGIGLLVSSNEVQEIELDYTYCNSTNPNHDSKTCDEIIKDDNKVKCTCELTFNLPVDYKKDVFLYYGLTNFYQNHRRYVKSRSDQQLLGKDSYSIKECEPFDQLKDKNKTVTIAPCGAIANSMFNDTLSLSFINEESHKRSQKIAVPLLNYGISWKTDSKKFQNPTSFDNTAKPAAWGEEMKQNYTNEDFIVWMRTAAFANFRKLYRRVNHDSDDDGFRNGLPKGKYLLLVDYRYHVTTFQGTKRAILLANMSWLGGRNPFLGIAYIVVGSVVLLLAILLLVVHNKFGRKSYGWESSPGTSISSNDERSTLKITE